jgi:hypothetical protein
MEQVIATTPIITPFDQETATRHFIKWIVCDLQPFTTAESPELHNFVECLNPQYRLPSRNQAKNLVMDRFTNAKVITSSILQDAPGSITLTTDIWTSVANDSYLGLTAHFIDSDWVMQHLTLTVEPLPNPHTGAVLKDTIMEILDEFGVTAKFHALVTDNAANMVKAFELLEEEMFTRFNQQIYHIRCSAHIFNLAVQKGLGIDDDDVRKPINKLRICTGIIKRSPKLCQELEHLCGRTGETCLTLSTDVPHRWNSTYKMISVALQMRRALDMLTAAADPGSALKESKLTDEDWEEVSNECKDLKIFDVTTRFLSAQKYPTLHRVHETYARIIRKLSENRTERNLRMITKLREYWEELPAETHLATMLCPYQKTQPLIHQVSTTQALTHGKMSVNRLAKLQADLVERHIELLHRQAEKYQDAHIEAMESNIPPPVSSKRRKTMELDVWEQFTAMTALESEQLGSSTL